MSLTESIADPRDDRTGSFRELFVVSLPLIISAGSHSLMNVADRVMLAAYSPASAKGADTLDVLAAVTPAAMLHWTLACIPLGTILYANTFISQFDGAGKPRDLVQSLWQTIWLAVVCGLLLILFVPWSTVLFELAGHSESVVEQETAYFDTLCLGSGAMLLSNALSCFFSGRQQTSTVMLVNIISVLINIVLDYLLIFGNAGLPELGITGAALATVLARVADIVLYVWLIRRSGVQDYPFASTWKPNAELLKKYLQYGVPSGLHYFVDCSGFFAFLLIVGSLDRNAMAATNLAFCVNSLIFIPLLGFGTAVQTLVGHHLGAGLPDAASRTTWNAIRMGAFWTGAAAVLLFVFPETALAPFLSLRSSAAADAGTVEAVIPMAADLLKFVAIYSVFDALAVVFASALRGAGDTFFPMMLNMVSSWFVMTIPAWLLVHYGQATITNLWLTCTAHITLMGTAMLLRFMSGRWKRIHLT